MLSSVRFCFHRLIAKPEAQNLGRFSALVRGSDDIALLSHGSHRMLLTIGAPSDLRTITQSHWSAIFSRKHAAAPRVDRLAWRDGPANGKMPRWRPKSRPWHQNN